jgi:ribosomal protein L28
MTGEETIRRLFIPNDHTDRYDAEGNFVKLTVKTETYLTELKCNTTGVLTEQEK